MLGKTTLFALFMLCLAVYQVSAQDEGEAGPPGEPGPDGPEDDGETELDLEPMDDDEDEDPTDDDEDDEDEGERGPPGEEGPAGPAGPSGPGGPGGPGPRRPPIRTRRCTVNNLSRIVRRRFRISRRTVTCTTVVNVRRCYGQCTSLYYTNPLTLTPVSRCSCCKPRTQYLANYNARFNCGRYGTRTGRVSVIQARTCGCKSC